MAVGRHSFACGTFAGQGHSSGELSIKNLERRLTALLRSYYKGTKSTVQSSSNFFESWRFCFFLVFPPHCGPLLWAVVWRSIFAGFRCRFIRRKGCSYGHALSESGLAWCCILFAWHLLWQCVCRPASFWFSGHAPCSYGVIFCNTQ